MYSVAKQFFGDGKHHIYAFYTGQDVSNANEDTYTVREVNPQGNDIIMGYAEPGGRRGGNFYQEFHKFSPDFDS